MIWLPSLYSTRRKIQVLKSCFWKSLQIARIIRKTIMSLQISETSTICYWAKWPVLCAPMKQEKQYSILRLTEANIWMYGHLLTSTLKMRTVTKNLLNLFRFVIAEYKMYFKTYLSFWDEIRYNGHVLK